MYIEIYVATERSLNLFCKQNISDSDFMELEKCPEGSPFTLNLKNIGLITAAMRKRTSLYHLPSSISASKEYVGKKHIGKYCEIIVESLTLLTARNYYAWEFVE